MIRDGNARLLALIAFWIATRPADVRFGYFRDGNARFFALDAFPTTKRPGHVRFGHFRDGNARCFAPDPFPTTKNTRILFLTPKQPITDHRSPRSLVIRAI